MPRIALVLILIVAWIFLVYIAMASKHAEKIGGDNLTPQTHPGFAMLTLDGSTDIDAFEFAQLYTDATIWKLSNERMQECAQIDSELGSVKNITQPPVISGELAGELYTVWHAQSNVPDVHLLIWYSSPCAMHRAVYITQKETLAAIRKALQIPSNSDKSVYRKAIAHGVSDNLFPADSYVAMPPVKEFDFQLLVGQWEWAAAPKLDGQPYILSIAGGRGILSIRNCVRQVFTAPVSAHWICAGELVQRRGSLDGAAKDGAAKDEFYIFDVVVSGGQDISSKPFAHRLRYFDGAARAIKQWWPAVHAQKFTLCGRSHEAWVSGVNSAREERKRLNSTGIDTDGIIIQRLGPTYADTVALKFKTKDELTVDIALYDGMYYSSRKGVCQKFDLDKVTAGDHKNGAKGGTPAAPPVIYEVNVSTGKQVKSRRNKQRPNSTTVTSQISHLYSYNISYDDLHGETVHILKVWMRKYEAYNLYKSIPRGSRILDIGAGSGRSHSNWKINNFRVWAVEPDPHNYQQLRERRVRELVDSKQIGGEDQSIQKWIGRDNIDAAVMVHSLTFFFAGNAMDGLISNLQHVVRPGGTVCGIGLDGTAVRRILDTSSGVIDSKAFHIKRIDDDTINITLKHDWSLVSGQTEHLTDFDKFKQRMTSAGFRLERTHMMPGNYMLGKWPLWFTQCTRMWVFIKGTT